MTITKKEVFDPKELNWQGVRFLDPIGRVFLLDGDYYRAIYPNKVDYVDSLFKTGIVEMLVNAGLMVPIQRTELSVKGYGMVLKTKGATWKMPAHTFTFRTLKTTALKWITINELLLKYNLGLIDAHLDNIVLTGRCEPKWLDLGSIQHLRQTYYGIHEFMSCQLYPLLVFECRPDLARAVRLLIQDGGVSHKELFAFVGWRLFRFPLVSSAIALIILMRKASRNYGMGLSLKRSRILRLLRFVIESISLKLPKQSWSDYRGFDICEIGKAGWVFSTDKERSSKVLELIKHVQPKTMLDIGSNDGYFSALAARSGAILLAIDKDEGAIDKFIQWVSATTLNLEAYGCVDDFHCVQYRADLVLGLALVHHLAISQMYKFDYIAKRFAEMSSRSLITEFMPNGLGIGERQPDPLPAYYNLDSFITELKKYFSRVDIVEYDRSKQFSPRVLIFCDGRFE